MQCLNRIALSMATVTKHEDFMLKSVPQSYQVGLAAFLVEHLQDAGVIRA